MKAALGVFLLGGAPLAQNSSAPPKRAQQNQQSVHATLFPKAMALERAFAKAGGTLIAVTDPAGAGGVVPGYSDQRQIELLVEAGFSPVRRSRSRS